MEGTQGWFSTSDYITAQDEGLSKRFIGPVKPPQHP
jgi:hypothetical protein